MVYSEQPSEGAGDNSVLGAQKGHSHNSGVDTYYPGAQMPIGGDTTRTNALRAMKDHDVKMASDSEESEFNREGQMLARALEVLSIEIGSLADRISPALSEMSPTRADSDAAERATESEIGHFIQEKRHRVDDMIDQVRDIKNRVRL